MGLYKFFSWKKFILGIILTQYAKRVFLLTDTHHGNTDDEGKDITSPWFVAFPISFGEEFEKWKQFIFSKCLNL